MSESIVNDDSPTSLTCSLWHVRSTQLARPHWLRFRECWNVGIVHWNPVAETDCFFCARFALLVACLDRTRLLQRRVAFSHFVGSGVSGPTLVASRRPSRSRVKAICCRFCGFSVRSLRPQQGLPSSCLRMRARVVLTVRGGSQL